MVYEVLSCLLEKLVEVDVEVLTAAADPQEGVRSLSTSPINWKWGQNPPQISKIAPSPSIRPSPRSVLSEQKKVKLATDKRINGKTRLLTGLLTLVFYRSSSIRTAAPDLGNFKIFSFGIYVPGIGRFQQLILCSGAGKITGNRLQAMLDLPV